MTFKLNEVGRRELILSYSIPIFFFVLTGAGSFLSLKKLSDFLYVQANSYSNLEHIHSIDTKSKKLSKENIKDIFSSLKKLKKSNRSRGKDKMIASLSESFKKIEIMFSGEKGIKRELSSLPDRDFLNYQIKQLKINERKEIEFNIRQFSNAIFITRKVILFGVCFTLLTSFSFLFFFIYSQN
ncbi:MAG: hypothetical protein CME68_09400 [Halobacteriovoraceae bacterium]|nr:hypothetical protein [Halobacteriovoraceae bacterium]